MPISKFCASEFSAKMTGYVYTLRYPEDGSIFYVGKTYDLKNRKISHISSARKASSSKEKIIAGILKAGKKPVMAIIERFPIRAMYDTFFYDYMEFYWIKQYLSYGWNLTNVRVNDVLNSETIYKELISNVKSGGKLPLDYFYYALDHKGFPIYDLAKIAKLGYQFSKSDFASHWAYIIDVEKYESVRETTLDYVYGDIVCPENMRHIE